MGPYFTHQPRVGATTVGNALSDLEQIEFMAPVSLGSRLIFQVLSNGLPVGYARLEKDPTVSDSHGVARLFSPPIHKDYVLKTIQVNRQFRRRGIGGRLLQEVARYCHDHQIERLSCSLEGNALLLRRWYLRNGFTSRDDNTLELLLG